MNWCVSLAKHGRGWPFMEKAKIRNIHQRSNSLTRDFKINCFHKTNIKKICCKRYQSQPWRYFDIGEENTMQMFQLKFRKPLQIIYTKYKSLSQLKRWVAFLLFKKLNLYFGFIGKQVNTPVRILAIFLLPTQKPPSRACELLLTWWSLACLSFTMDGGVLTFRFASFRHLCTEVFFSSGNTADPH